MTNSELSQENDESGIVIYLKIRKLKLEEDKELVQDHINLANILLTVLLLTVSFECTEVCKFDILLCV